MKSAGVYQRGETITLRFGVEEGSDAVVGVPTAKLKPIVGGRVPGAETPSLAELLVTPADAAGDLPAGWNVTVPAVVSATLRQGTYGTDLRFELGAGVHISDPIFFRMVEAVTQ